MMKYDIYLNMTHFCNVNCPRCYLTDTQRKDRAIIPLDKLEMFLSFKSFATNGGEGVNVTWLGGEVTTLSLDVLNAYKEVINRILPKARNVLITNLYSIPNKLLDFIKETFDCVETTYAEGHKISLDGSETTYKEHFIKNLKKMNDAGIELYVNVELNDATIEKDPVWLIDMARQTGQKLFEFDISVRFDIIHQLISQGIAPVNELGYPDQPPLTINYKQWEEYVSRYLTEYESECKELGIEIGFFKAAAEKAHDAFFSTAYAAHLFTLTPDGTVFGTPVYSGIPPLAFGKVGENTEEEIVGSPLRMNHMYFENVIRLDGAKCHECRFAGECRGSFSSVPVEDGSGTCAGMYNLREYIEDAHLPMQKNDDSKWKL